MDICYWFECPLCLSCCLNICYLPVSVTGKQFDVQRPESRVIKINVKKIAFGNKKKKKKTLQNSQWESRRGGVGGLGGVGAVFFCVVPSCFASKLLPP